MSKARNMARMGQDTSAGYTGAFDMPAGTTAERPASAGLGWTRLNTDTGSVEVYDGTNWNAVTRPFISSVTGTIYEGATSNLVIAGQNMTSTITVRFLEGGSTVADVSGVSVSAGSATVAVPAAVYGQTAGDSIEVKIINSDGTMSSNGITKTVIALPTGGTITTSGSYRIHTFTSSSSFVVPSGLTLSNVEYVVVAGGGGGGNGRAAGGGAGGYRSSVSGESSGGGASAEAKLTLSANSYTVTIGGGGAGATSVGADGVNGQNSVFGSITSLGGGKGAGYLIGNAGGTITGGGTGGGSTPGMTGQPVAGTSGQGYAGGLSGSGSGVYPTGGGGGAGAVGGNGNDGTNTAGSGGVGVQSSINGTATYRAGGGGGGTYNGGTYGSGGNGGGGRGGSIGATVNAVAGTANTGGGGGGGGYDASTAGNGNNGGSGIVIVRYQLS